MGFSHPLSLPWEADTPRLTRGSFSFPLWQKGRMAEVMEDRAAVLLVVLAIAVALGGIALAWHMYIRRPATPDRLASHFPGLYRTFLNKYYVDEFYQTYVVEPIYRLMNFLWDFDAKVVDGAVNGSSLITVATSRFSGIFDLQTVDGAVNGTGSVIRFFSQVLKFIQSGMVQNYVFFMLIGLFLMLSGYLFR